MEMDMKDVVVDTYSNNGGITLVRATHIPTGIESIRKMPVGRIPRQAVLSALKERLKNL
ncbi:MAG: hypothetical protein V3R25_10160 [Nitrosomonadaceae bacterium]